MIGVLCLPFVFPLQAEVAMVGGDMHRTDDEACNAIGLFFAITCNY